MAECGSDYSQVSKAQLKRDLAHDLCNIDLQIYNLRSQGNQEAQIRMLETAKVQIQKDMVEKKMALELKDAQSSAVKRGRR